MAKRQFSMRPEAAEEGLWGNKEARIASAIYGTYGEHGTEAMLVGDRSAEDPVGVIEFDPENDEEEPTKVFFSCGSAERLVPSEDGDEPASEGPFLCPPEGSQAKGLNKGTRMYSLLASISKPKDGKLKFNSAILDEKGLDALIGLKGYWARVPAPRMSSIAADEDSQPKTMIVCERIIELPASKGKKAKVKAEAEDEAEDESPKKKKAKPEKEEESEESDVTTEAQAMVVNALEKAGSKGIKADLLFKKVFAELAKSENKKEIIALLKDEDFLADGPWTVDGDTLQAIE